MTLRVLVADDDDDLRTLIREQFEAAGWDVLEAKDGAELVANAEMFLPDGLDLIVTDVQMPVMTGLEAMAELARKQLNWSRIIVMSSFLDTATHARATHLGALVVVEKPVTGEELTALADKLLSFGL